MTLLCAMFTLWLGTSAHAQSIIKIDGSSTVFPLTEAVSEEFQHAKKAGGFRVTVGVSGTGGGFKKFCRGETDLQDASRPISVSEMADCKAIGVKYIELPVAYDAITVAVNPDEQFLSEITIADLKKIWSPGSQNVITKWNQVEAAWPANDLKLYGPGSDSGTFDFFTEAVIGKAHSSRGDYTASQDHNATVTGISTDKHALGFLPLSYLAPATGKLKALAVIGPNGKAVLPSRKTVEDASYYLSRPVFLYVSESALKKAEVRDFVEFYLDHAIQLSDEIGLVPLPMAAYVMDHKHIQETKLGTLFGGKSFVGWKIEDVMKRESAL